MNQPIFSDATHVVAFSEETLIKMMMPICDVLHDIGSAGGGEIVAGPSLVAKVWRDNKDYQGNSFFIMLFTIIDEFIKDDPERAERLFTKMFEINLRDGRSEADIIEIEERTGKTLDVASAELARSVIQDQSFFFAIQQSFAMFNVMPSLADEDTVNEVSLTVKELVEGRRKMN